MSKFLKVFFGIIMYLLLIFLFSWIEFSYNNTELYMVFLNNIRNISNVLLDILFQPKNLLILILVYLILFEWEFTKNFFTSIIYKIIRIEGFGFSIILDNRKERDFNNLKLNNLLIENLHELKGTKIHITEFTKKLYKKVRDEDIIGTALSILELQKSGVVEMKLTIKNGNLKDMEIDDVLVREKN